MMADDTALHPVALFKNDSARRIDHLIDYFGDAPADPGDDRRRDTREDRPAR
jgi:hypothetical protein